jgi:hypothetical protein
MEREPVSRLIDEFRAIPWNARGRKVGHVLELVAGTIILVFGPAFIVGLVNLVAP